LGALEEELPAFSLQREGEVKARKRICYSEEGERENVAGRDHGPDLVNIEPKDRGGRRNQSGL